MKNLKHSVFVLIFNIVMLEARHTRLMVFVDIQESEFLSNNIPVSLKCTAALYEQAGPVLVSSGVFKTLMYCLRRFKGEIQDMVQKADYYAIYQKIDDHLQQIFSKIPDKNQENITADIAYELKQALSIDEFFQNKSMITIPNMEETDQGIALMQITFDEWDIYSLDDEWFLFIPKEYQRQMEEIYACEKFFHDEVLLNAVFYDEQAKRAVTEHEMAIGLKIDSLKKLTELPVIFVNSLSEEQKKIMQTKEYMQKLCSRLFVNIDDMPNIHNADLLLPLHNIYLNGHGKYLATFPRLDSLLQESRMLQKRIGFFVGKPGAIVKKQQQEEVEQLKKLEQEIDKMIETADGKIAGLSMFAYTAFLDFLNTKIFVDVLYYYTCFGGGKYLYIPFVSRGLDKIYNYTIVSGVFDDVSGITSRPYFNILLGEKKVDIIYKKGVPHPHLGYQTTISFAKFFDAVEHNLALNKLLQYITFNEPSNVPAIRLPGTVWFSAAKLDSVAYITNTTISTAKTKKFIDVAGKKTILLYAPIIPLTIKISPKKNASTPLFVSAITDQQMHWIQSLEAPKYELTSIIDGFFNEDLLRKRIILIDSLTAYNNFGQKNSDMLGIKQGEKVELTKVCLFNGVQSPLIGLSNWERGILFMCQGKVYKAVYAKKQYVLWNKNDQVMITSNPVNHNQDIIDVANNSEETATIEEYEKYYNNQKKEVEKNASRLIEVEQLEDFVHKHLEKVKQKTVSKKEKAWKAKRKKHQAQTAKEQP